MNGEHSKHRPGPVESIKWRERGDGEKKKRPAGLGVAILLIIALLAILFLRCDAPEPGKSHRAKACSVCGWEQPHHASNCKNKQ